MRRTRALFFDGLKTTFLNKIFATKWKKYFSAFFQRNYIDLKL